MSWLEGLVTKGEITNAIKQQYKKEEIFFRTYYSGKSIKKFSKQKKTGTKEDAPLIFNFYHYEEFKSCHKQYTLDTQNGGSFDSEVFRSEALTRICFKLGYNPFGVNDSLRKFDDE